MLNGRDGDGVVRHAARLTADMKVGKDGDLSFSI
jgi:hypothetical protein